MENDLLFSSPSKFDILNCETTVIPRKRLMKRLDEGLNGKLTLICAPAGYGKTTLVYDWLKKRKLSAVWFHSDKLENDLIRPVPKENASEAEIYVFDDCHLIQSEGVYKDLHSFIQDLPENVHAVLMTREEPLFSLSSLRMSGCLNELRLHDLRLSKEEAARWIACISNVLLTKTEIENLEKWTEGWPAVICFAAYALHQGMEFNKLISSLPGHPSLVEYFNLQVMEPLSDELQTFLLKTSILEWMAPGLCEALIGKKNAQKGFRKVEKMHFFVAIEDQVQPFLRHHPLLAEFLREEATHRFSDEISVLHRKASRWLQKNGFWNEAVEHALKGEDYDTAGRLINQFAPELFRRGELALLKRWLGHFPKFPSKLMLVHAWTEVLSGECENAFRLLGSTKEITLAEKAMLEGYIALSRRDVRRAFERFQAGTEKGGGLDRFFQKGIDLNQGEVQILRGVLGMGGRLNDVDWLYMERMRNLWKHKEPGILGYGSDIVAELLYEQNQLDDLMYFIIRGIELGKRHENIGVLVSIHLVYIRLKKIERKVNEVWAIYENIKRIVEKSGSKKWLPVLKAFEVRMMLWEGDGNAEELDIWMVDCETLEPNPPDFAREFEILTLVRVLMFRKQYSRAQRLLKKWLSHAEQIERVGSQIEILILLGLVFQKRGKTNQAFLHIRRALHLAEPEGYIRSFLDEGFPLAELLASVLQKDGNLANCPRLLAYIERLLLLFEGEIGVCHWNESNQSLIEPLTQRELDILGYIEKGLANSEIAGRLGIQTGTVKGYIVNLYGKLGVQSRVKAAGKAKELGLVKR